MVAAVVVSEWTVPTSSTSGLFHGIDIPVRVVRMYGLTLSLFVRKTMIQLYRGNDDEKREREGDSLGERS